MKVDKLLAVLDLPEEEQIAYLIEDAIIDCQDDLAYEPTPTESLADFSFRLRNEISKNDINFLWKEGCESVYEYCYKESDEYSSFDAWWLYISQPIHWIIAALIAKEFAKGEKSL